MTREARSSKAGNRPLASPPAGERRASKITIGNPRSRPGGRPKIDLGLLAVRGRFGQTRANGFLAATEIALAEGPNQASGGRRRPDQSLELRTHRQSAVRGVGREPSKGWEPAGRNSSTRIARPRSQRGRQDMRRARSLSRIDLKAEILAPFPPRPIR